jgi:GntR family transcriptional regulator, arabinose operon transcriptional repressor
VPDPFLYERVYSHVLEEIRNESFKPGERVPSEKELAEQFGVSRITSKRALRMLAEAGVVDRRRGQGSFVTNDAHRLEAIRRSRGRKGELARRSGCLALVLPDASEAYGLGLLRAIEERSAELGYHLVVRRTRDSQEVEEQAVGSLVGDGVADGLIVFPVHGEFYNASLLRLVLDRFPLVLVDRYLRGIRACAVFTDNVAAARSLTSYVLDDGHDQVVFLSPPVENTSSIEERMLGFQEVLRERGYPPEAQHCLTEFHSTLPNAGSADVTGVADQADLADLADLDRKALRAFLRQAPGITGFVACEYDIAVLVRQVLDEADEQGRGSPGRRAIACFDSPEQPSATGRFVYIKQDQQEMGRQAVDLLVAQLAGDEVPLKSVLPFTLVDPTTA